MPASAFVRTLARIYTRAASSCYIAPSERERAKERERTEKEREREVDRESTEEVEGRLASIRERDADRVGESWVRSHKEVDTRRHLNPPRPPFRRPPPSPVRTPRRNPLAVLPSRTSDPTTLTLSRSLVVPSLYFAHSRSVRLALCIYCSSFSLSLPPSVAILSLHWRSLRASLPTLSRRETHPRSRSAKLRLPEDRRGWLEDFFVTAGRCCAS